MNWQARPDLNRGDPKRSCPDRIRGPEYKSWSKDRLLFYSLIMFYTYILQSVKSGRYYIGHTSDIEERLVRHNSGKVTATRNKGPWTVVYFETYETKAEANSRELFIKSMKSRVFIEKLILGFKK